jgi:biotin operon repressor
LADLIVEVAAWRGFAASVATKILHKKRPALIPILDNQAIFGAYLNPKWPTQPSSRDSVYAKGRVKEALEWIAFDLARSNNALSGMNSRRSSPVAHSLRSLTWCGGCTSVRWSQSARFPCVRRQPMSTVGSRILEVLYRETALDEDQLAARLGIVRQQVNQTCRRLEREGLLIRERGAQGKIVNRLSSKHRESSGPILPTSTSSDWFWEGNVQEAIKSYLTQQGWTIKEESDVGRRSRRNRLSACANSPHGT